MKEEYYIITTEQLHDRTGSTSLSTECIVGCYLKHLKSLNKSQYSSHSIIFLKTITRDQYDDYVGLFA